MTTAPSPDGRRSGPPGILERFDRAERLLHWANAVLFVVLIATAAVLYVGVLSALVGRRDVVRQVHVVAGVLLPVPLAVALVGPWRRGVRRDLRALNRWDDDDRRWMRSFGRDPFARLGKFHPGQKLNAAFTAGVIAVMLGTGAVMRWFGPFPVDWRTGATFVHDWLALAVYVVVTVHVLKALSDRDAMRSMIGGQVPSAWARRHRPKWHDEMVR